MKRMFAAVVVFLFILCAGMPAGLTAAEPNQQKIGTVDLLKAINDSEAGKRAKVDLEALIKSKQAAIDDKGKNIERLKTELDKQTAIISAEARKAKEEELERLYRDYQRVVADSQAEVKKKEGDLTGEILKEVRELIGRIGQEEKYTLILELSDGSILFSDKSMDITEIIIKKYDDSKKK